ncbi:Vacuolar protease A [Aphelenchoides fujianensis]|nr:Vacuolar protease A [Aphelenchoides fujianensis]
MLVERNTHSRKMRSFRSFFLFASFCFSFTPAASFDVFPLQVNGFFGTPGQPAVLLGDLNAEGVWLISSECSACSHTSFDPSSSSTFRNESTAQRRQFGPPLDDQTADCGGYSATDRVLLIPEIHVENETQSGSFSLITAINGDDPTVLSATAQFDGRIGLGLTSGKNGDSMAFDLLFGGFDRLLCVGTVGDDETWMEVGRAALEKRIKYTNLTSAAARPPADRPAGWEFDASSWSFGAYTTSASFSVLLSTTTAFIHAPSALVDLLVAQLNAREDPSGELQVDCEWLTKSPEFQVEIGDVDVSVPPAAFILQLVGSLPPSLFITLVLDDEMCLLQFRRLGAADRFVLGRPLLVAHSLCLDFDLSVVSFLDARLKPNEDA